MTSGAMSACARSFMAPHLRPRAHARKAVAKPRQPDATSSSCGRKVGRLLWLLRSCLLLMVVAEQQGRWAPLDVDPGEGPPCCWGGPAGSRAGGEYGLDGRTGRTPQEALAGR